MRVEYNFSNGGTMIDKDSFSEFAKLYDDYENEVGGLQILYFTNGQKNMAYIERVFIKPEFQKKGYATYLLNDVVQHIIESDIQINNSGYESLTVTNNQIDSFENTYERGLDEIFLLAEKRLSPLYEKVGFENKSSYEGMNDQCVFKIDLDDFKDKSLEDRISSLN